MSQTSEIHRKSEGSVGAGATLVWNVQSGVTGLAVSVALTVGIILLSGPIDTVFTVLLAVTVLTTLFECLVLNKLRARAFKYSLDMAGLVIQQGAFLSQTTSVPRQQILYTRIRRGPVSRRLGLSTFVVGVLGREFPVPCLSLDDALALRDSLSVTDDHGEHW